MTARADGRGRFRFLLVAVLVVGVGLSGVWAVASASKPDPRKAAKELVARTPHGKLCSFGSSKVTSRGGRLWLAIGRDCDRGPEGPIDDTRLWFYLWSGTSWRLDGTVRAALGPTQSVFPASLTGSAAPDFVIQGCGAGGRVCTSVITKDDGKWHPVPFESGYGQSLDINGGPEGHLVFTNYVRPATQMYTRYDHGVFVPAYPPGRTPRCSATLMERAADPNYIQAVRFAHAWCAGGWALAVGDGAGVAGPGVGLFMVVKGEWSEISLDNGNLLPAAPAIYDLPLSLLERLAAPAGETLAPHVAAARLIASLQSREHFFWPQRNGIVDAGGERWLIAVVPAGKPPNDYSPGPVAAEIYRWDRTQWVLDGRIAQLDHGLNADWNGGWFTPEAQATPRPSPSGWSAPAAKDPTTTTRRAPA